MSTGTPPWSEQPPPGAPPEAWEPLLRVVRRARAPVDRFLRVEAASGIVLLVAAIVALTWANSSWREGYFALWHTPIGIRVGDFAFERTLEWFVNDVLMVIFFFVVGLEIRHEVHDGELRDWRRAVLPLSGALGGMVVPALIYLLFAGAADTRSGWGVPMATDIAFALGILMLLGRRVPPALRVLLLALAIIDDLGAIAVIAMFYSSGVEVSGLLVAALGASGIVALQSVGVRAKLAYVLPSALAWAGIYGAGIHPTIAGVLVGAMTPVRAWFGPDGFAAGVQRALDDLLRINPRELSLAELAGIRSHLDRARREAMSPALSLMHTLHPWVAFGIMPVFALANAGVLLESVGSDAASWNVGLGIAAGLVVGKPLGILLATWMALRLRWGTLPAGLGYGHLVVLGVVGGVGFTMSLFIAQLAFVDGNLLSAAKVGVLLASAAAAVLALALGWVLLSPEVVDPASERTSQLAA
jgi:Na+:H+ antiporter, NhaA family